MIRATTLAALTLLCVQGCGIRGLSKPPTDDLLIERFLKNKTVYLEFVQRINHDFKNYKYASIWYANGALQTAPKDIILQKDKNHYIRFFEQLAPMDTLVSEQISDSGHRNIYFYHFRTGMVFSGGETKGVAYIPENINLDVVKNLDAFVKEEVRAGRAPERTYFYRRIEGSWFVVYSFSKT